MTELGLPERGARFVGDSNSLGSDFAPFASVELQKEHHGTAAAMGCQGVTNVKSGDVQLQSDLTNVESDDVNLQSDVANVGSDDVQLQSDVANVIVQTTPSTWPQTLSKLRQKATVEIIVFFSVFAMGLMGPTMQALVYRKVCLEKFNRAICDNLTNGNHQVEEDQVQTQAAHWFMAENLCYEVPAILLCTFYGSLSDNVSRKAALLIPVIGQLISVSSAVVNSVYMELPLGFILIGPFVSGLFGGSVTAAMACFSYLSEITTSENRTTRIAIVEGIILISIAAALFIGGKLLDSTSFVFVTALALGLYVFTAVYTLVWIREPPSSVRAGRRNCGAIWQNVFNPKAVKVALGCVFKNRPRNRRTQILVSLGVLISGSVGLHAGSLAYLFVKRQPLKWSQTLYGYFTGYGAMVSAISLVFVLPVLRKKLRMRDTNIITIAFMSMSLSMVLFAFSTVTWMVFLTPLVGILGALYVAILRSMLSKMVGKDELGRMFAVFAALQSVNGLISSLLYNNLYPATLHFWNGFCFIVGATICIVPMMLATWLGRDLKRYGWDSYGTLSEHQPGEETGGAAAAAAEVGGDCDRDDGREEDGEKSSQTDPLITTVVT